MIGVLSGVVVEVRPDCVVVDAGGLGYEVYCHGRDLASVPKVGSNVRLHTDLQLRNELLRLYGFLGVLERDWFRLLCGVHHVGAKGALSILGTLRAGELADAVALGDPRQIQRAPGIGKRIAERVVMELKGKGPMPMAVRQDDSIAGVQSDAISALVGLGYSSEVALSTVRATMLDLPGAPLEVLIHGALRRLGQSND